MTEGLSIKDYQNLIIMSAAVWRFIDVIRTPILSRVHDRLVVGFPNNGLQVYQYFVWVIAFVLGYGAAMAAGMDGDMLAKLGWFEGHLQEFGYVLTAGLIACGSAGLRLAEKWIDDKMPVNPNA